jgi:hypothetical protein
MSDRSLIFNAKGAQIGYTEGDRAFDLTGRERCNYAPATGNLSELNGKKIVGYVSLDGTFVGLSWMSDELFGKPSAEVHPDRTLARKPRLLLRPNKAKVQRPEKSGVKEPGLTLQTATAPHPENLAEHSPTAFKAVGDPGRGSNTSKIVVDEVPLLEGEVGRPDSSNSSSTENELFGRAIGMIRSALEKGSE